MNMMKQKKKNNKEVIMKVFIISIIVVVLILIGFFNPFTQYLLAFHGDNRIRAEDIIFNSPVYLKKNICGGFDLSVIDFENNRINDYYKKIRKLGIGIEVIGYYNNKYYFEKSEPNISEIEINGITTDFSTSFNLTKVSIGEFDWIKIINGMFYFLSENHLDIYSIVAEKKLIKQHHLEIEKSVKKTNLINNQYLVYNISQKKPKKYDLVLIDIDNNKKDILYQNTYSYCVYENIIYYNNKEGNLYKYNIQSKEIVGLNCKVQYINEKYNVKDAGDLIEYKDDKLFFITGHMDWEMPFNMIHYYDLDKHIIVDVAKVVGVFNHFQLIFN